MTVHAQPDPQSQELGSRDQVTWIGRERAPIEPPSGPIEPETRQPSEPEGLPATGGGLRLRIISGIIAVVVAALAVALAMRFLKHTAPVSQSAEGSIPLVSARAPGLSAVTQAVTFNGTINARYDMPIGTDGETGRVTAVYVEAGDHVKKGQVLAKIDDSILRPQVERLTAALDEERANAALAQAEYARAEGVQSAGALSAEDIEKRKATAITGAAQVKVAAAQLAEYQARLAHTEVRAPADGVVLTRTAEVGQIATPGGSALFRLARGGEVELRGQVAEQDLPSLEVGQPASVRLTGSERPFAGKVRLLGAVIDPQTRLGDIRIVLEPDPMLRPGAFARGEVVVGRGRRPVLPQTAVLSDERGAYVYVVSASNRIERRAVGVSDTTAQGLVIGSGLTGTERVVMTAAAFLRPDEQVAVAPDTGS
jgi:HlyD family secretion protein